MQAYLVDTNILIYQLSGQLLPTSRELLKDLLEENKAHISVITRIEVLGWRLHTAESQMLAQRVLQQFQEMPLEEAVIRRCIQLRQTYAIKLPDAIIAATSLHLSLPLMTRNTKDFESIPTLRLFNPFET